MRYEPKKIIDNHNVTPHHPLTNFAYLLGTVVIITVLIFVVLGFVADWLSTQISPETESEIGQKLLPGFLEESEELVEDKRIQYLDNLLKSLPKSGEEVRLPLTIHLLENDQVNAAIIPGGHVFIHTALLEMVKSENELAFVLAHELGHFQAYDPVKSLGRSLVMIVGLMAVGFGSSELSSGPNVIAMTGELTYLNYSRSQEKNADIYALYRIVNHYGHGGHSLDFFKQLAQQEKEEGEEKKKLMKVSQYFSTHPLNEARIKMLTLLANENGWDMKGEPTPLPKWLHCPNMEPCESPTG
jgi:beta-barrel assembly-enhancing protease